MVNSWLGIVSTYVWTIQNHHTPERPFIMAITLPSNRPFCLHATLIHSTSSSHIKCLRNILLVVDADGKITHLLPNIPPSPDSIKNTLPNHPPVTILPWPRYFLVPSFIDTHVHAPQYAMRGLGSARGMEILDWLDEITFPEEARFEDAEHGKKVYGECVRNSLKQGVGTACCKLLFAQESARSLSVSLSPWLLLIAELGEDVPQSLQIFLHRWDPQFLRCHSLTYKASLIDRRAVLITLLLLQTTPPSIPRPPRFSQTHVSRKANAHSSARHAWKMPPPTLLTTAKPLLKASGARRRWFNIASTSILLGALYGR